MLPGSWHNVDEEDLVLRAARGRSRCAVVLTTSVATIAALAGCGSSSGTTTSANTRSSAANSSSNSAGGRPTVLAAASLSKVFPAIAPNAKYTFGGSGALEVDIEQGAPADVFAAASPKQPAALLAKGLVEKPVEFATNTLVLIVPKDNPAHITSVSDITRPGVKLVICDATVPCGDYARNVFKNLGIAAAAMKNVVSQTTDVTQTVAEVALGQADAGFVYVTDADAAKGKVVALRLPAAAKPSAKDFIAVVKSAPHPAAAKAFVASILAPAGQAKLRAAGFGAP
jgi:molybdate transport system substrate-binding protein